ncbi:type VI secretion protein VasK, partial [Pectobacterium odoriferum]|nr:type VI secretion protein VasK [Pectobacterium odoriferum]
MIEQKILPNTRYGSWGYFLLVIGLAGISAFVLFINQDSLNSIGISTQKIWTIWGGVFAVLLLGLIGSPVWWRWKQRRNQAVYKPQAPGENLGPLSVVGSDAVQSFSSLKKHLGIRYRFFWRRKVRLLLVTGDEVAIEQLVPGLQQQQWLEGHRTVLIYGGSLTAEIDAEKYTALRKLRRGRPLDGIVRVMPESLNLTSQISDNDLRGLEKIGELLRYQPPVWLWQLCNSDWSQNGRTEQAVGAFFPLRAKPDDITRQLENLLPALNAQGMSQVVENNSHDFLLRLGQHLKDGGISRWAQQLTPWLYANQQRVPLRGLVFSLPEAASADGEKAANEASMPFSSSHR